MFNRLFIKKRRIKYYYLALWAFVVLWAVRVVWINIKITNTTKYTDIGKEVYISNFCIIPDEAYLLSKGEYINMFNIDADSLDSCSEKFVCVRLSIRNISNSSIGLGDVERDIGVGFETDTWASLYDAQQGSMINFYNEEFIEPGEDITMWMVTNVNRKCFKKRTWNNLCIHDFCFVLSLRPSSIKIRL